MTIASINQAGKRFATRFLIAMFAYSIALPATIYAFRHHHPAGWSAYALALLPTLPIVATLVIVGLYLREQTDGFQSAILVQSLLVAIAGTLAFATAWGFLELFTPVPHFQLYLLYPIFWAFVGVANPIVSARYS